MFMDDYINRTEFEADIKIPTDSPWTRVRGNRRNIEIRKVYDVEPVLKQAELFRKIGEDTGGYITPDRSVQMIGVVPTHVEIKILRDSQGDTKESEKLRKRFLKAHGEFATINKNKI